MPVVEGVYYCKNIEGNIEGGMRSVEEEISGSVELHHEKYMFFKEKLRMALLQFNLIQPQHKLFFNSNRNS